MLLCLSSEININSDPEDLKPNTGSNPTAELKSGSNSTAELKSGSNPTEKVTVSNSMNEVTQLQNDISDKPSLHDTSICQQMILFICKYHHVALVVILAICALHIYQYY